MCVDQGVGLQKGGERLGDGMFNFALLCSASEVLCSYPYEL